MRKAILLGILLVLLSVVLGTVYAHSWDQPVEWEANPGSLHWTLTDRGMGWTKSWDGCDTNDRIFQINRTASANPENYRIYSSNSAIQAVLAGDSPIGHDLLGSQAHICIGYRDWSFAGWANIQQNMFVWVK